jgi:hypothetical protein
VSSDVELVVTFHCSSYDGIAQLAQRHLERLRASASPAPPPEVRVFLEELAARAGPTDRGPKNGLAVWSYGGNYTIPQAFATALRPFWDELLRYPVPGGPLRFNHIVILYRLQDRESCDALEIFLELPEDYYDRIEELPTWPLCIHTHKDLPFRW